MAIAPIDNLAPELRSSAGRPRPAAARSGTKVRPEVQALRAIAVLLVVLYHL